MKLAHYKCQILHFAGHEISARENYAPKSGEEKVMWVRWGGGKKVTSWPEYLRVSHHDVMTSS